MFRRFHNLLKINSMKVTFPQKFSKSPKCHQILENFFKFSQNFVQRLNKFYSEFKKKITYNLLTNSLQFSCNVLVNKAHFRRTSASQTKKIKKLKFTFSNSHRIFWVKITSTDINPGSRLTMVFLLIFCEKYKILG